jgi:multidrug efflux pump
MSVREAALAAAASRFRPILMTTLAMIFGTLPIALSLGTSSGSRTSLGIVVVGGLVFAGVLTLYVIPAVYSYFSQPHRAKQHSVNKGLRTDNMSVQPANG